MQKTLMKMGVKILLAAVCLTAVLTNTVLAEMPRSQNFELSEPQFGAGSALEMCSGQYCAKASIGDISPDAVDGPRSSSTSAFSKLTTDSEPLLEVIVEPGESNLGFLSTEETASKTTTVKVRNYESDGYILQIVGNPPKFEDHTLGAPTTPTESKPGKEQFALNAVANTTPTIGANPKQLPNGEISFGYVKPGYDTPNKYQYKSGDEIARSDAESGHTEYTLSMIINIANSTPAGHFATDFSAVVVPIF